MKVLPIRAFYDNYIWLIIDEKNQRALCVDSGEAKPVITFLKQNALKLDAILLTHHHDDHIDGVTELHKENPEIIIYGPKDSRIPQVTHPVEEKEIVSLHSFQFHVLATPGHTTTHLSFYEPYHRWLFCGDTLFSAGCGRVFDGTIEALYHSLGKLKALPDNTQVYCAHEYTRQNLRFASLVEPQNAAILNYLQSLPEKRNHCSLPSSIALEKQVNPFLRTHLQRVKEYAVLRGENQLDSLSVFKQIRADKDHFS